MSEPRAKTESLRQQIERSFESTEYPGHDKLVYDNTGYHLECSEIATAFKDKHWKDIPLDLLRYHSAALSFFTPEAYSFFLPAYLLATLDDYFEADVIPGSVIFSLIPPTDPQDVAIYGELSRRRLQALRPEQREAIRSFLEFLKREHPEDDPLGNIDKALASVRH